MAESTDTPKYIKEFEELEASGGLEKVSNLIESKANVWVKRTSGEWQVGKAFEQGFGGLTVGVKWFDEKRMKDVGKHVDTKDFLRWQEEQPKLPEDTESETISSTREKIAEADRFQEETEANGIAISCHWDDGYNNYVLYFPDMPFPPNVPGIYDQIFRISEDSETAKQVYEFAIKQAENGFDMYQVYRKAEKYARQLNRKAA